jgi:hypothetical protein
MAEPAVSSTPVAHLTRLPDDTLFLICKQLSAPQVQILASVNRQLHTKLLGPNADQQIWRHLYHQTWNPSRAIAPLTAAGINWHQLYMARTKANDQWLSGDWTLHTLAEKKNGHKSKLAAFESSAYVFLRAAVAQLGQSLSVCRMKKIVDEVGQTVLTQRSQSQSITRLQPSQDPEIVSDDPRRLPSRFANVQHSKAHLGTLLAINRDRSLSLHHSTFNKETAEVVFTESCVVSAELFNDKKNLEILHFNYPHVLIGFRSEVRGESQLGLHYLNLDLPDSECSVEKALTTGALPLVALIDIFLGKRKLINGMLHTSHEEHTTLKHERGRAKLKSDIQASAEGLLRNYLTCLGVANDLINQLVDSGRGQRLITFNDLVLCDTSLMRIKTVAGKAQVHSYPPIELLGTMTAAHLDDECLIIGDHLGQLNLFTYDRETDSYVRFIAINALQDKDPNAVTKIKRNGFCLIAQFADGKILQWDYSHESVNRGQDSGITVYTKVNSFYSDGRFKKGFLESKTTQKVVEQAASLDTFELEIPTISLEAALAKLNIPKGQ